jgi:hypothetical protein
MTEPMNQSVSIDDLHEALAAAEQQMAGVREQIHACESRLRGLVNTGLTDEQHEAAREQIRAEHRGLIEHQRTIADSGGRPCCRQYYPIGSSGYPQGSEAPDQ